MTYSDHAIILKRYNLGEADKLITLFTKNHGKQTAVAPGIRKVTSRRGGHLELFNHVQVFLAKGKNLDIITEAKIVEVFGDIKNDLQKVGQAYYVMELIDSLLYEGQKNYKVFLLSLDVLRKLNGIVSRSSKEEEAKVLRQFEVDLLRTLGFWSDEVHGRQFPKDLREQARFNQILIQGIIEKELKSPKFLQKI